MKLIIELKDETYKFFKEKLPIIIARTGKTLTSDVYEAIRDGTPYNPTGDLISREAVKANMKKAEEQADTFEMLVELYEQIIDNAQAIEHSLLPLSGEADNAYMRGYEIGKAEGIMKGGAVPQVTVFTESTNEKAVADLKAELQSVIEARPQGDCISRSDLKKKFDKECQNDCSVCEHSRFDSFKGYYHCGLIDNAQAIPLPNEQIAWEQGYEAGLAQGKHSRQKGEWIECRSSDHWKCDKCGHPAPLESRDCEWLSNFCPNCGADMRKGGTE